LEWPVSARHKENILLLDPDRLLPKCPRCRRAMTAESEDRRAIAASHLRTYWCERCAYVETTAVEDSAAA
jgi:hypothetical protein